MDIGGANTKAAWLDGGSLRTVSRPFEVWRDREALAAVLREVATEVAAGPPSAVAITMTAELSDAFRTKREGVAFVLDAAQDAFGDRPLSVLTTDGELVPVEAARARPWEVAAANWMATAPFARERIARLVCADVDQLGEDEIDAIAAFLHDEQLRRLEDAARRVQRRLPPDAPVVAVGSGAFLGPEVAARLGRAVADAPAAWGAAGTEVAPAAALAALLAARLC